MHPDDHVSASDPRPWVTLGLVPGVSPALYRRLVDRFGSPARALGAPAHELVAAGVRPATVAAIGAGAVHAAAAEEVARADAVGARIVTWADADYPESLRGIADAPPCLYVRGALVAADGLAVAIVGARAASAAGRDMAAALAAELARAGVTVVSGLAYGIDAAAHRGALAAGGRSIAVLGSGVDVVYPAAHAEIAAAAIGRGALVSEFGMGTPPLPHHFPLRNRIISGLVRAVVVVEASERSGSLITARHAFEQGREVLAVPGPPAAARSRGPHLLIRNGATLVTSAADVFEELGIGARPAPRAGVGGAAAVVPAPSPAAAAMLAVLGEGAVEVDGLVARTGLTPREVLRILLELELAGRVRQLPGAAYELSDTPAAPAAYAARG
jgi:DNA processing protein